MMLLVLPLLLLLVSLAEAKVSGVWIDVEGIDGAYCPTESAADCAGRTATFIATLHNATAIAHEAGMRFAVDANVAWATATGTDAVPDADRYLCPEAQRPLHQQVMDIAVSQRVNPHSLPVAALRPTGLNWPLSGRDYLDGLL